MIRITEIRNFLRGEEEEEDLLYATSLPLFCSGLDCGYDEKNHHYGTCLLYQYNSCAERVVEND